MSKFSALFLSVLVLLCCSASTLQAQKLTAKENAFFEKSVRPLLAKHCYKCHSKKATKVKGGLYLDSQAGWMDGGDSGPSIVSGSPEKSLLIKAVKYEDEDIEMPPKEKLSDSEIAILTRWVRMGAPDPRTSGKADRPITRSIDIAKGRQFWAFKKPTSPPLPEIAKASWPLGTIDRFILESLEDKKLRPAPDAGRATLIRRVTYDLTGLPPTPQEVEAFLADKSPKAFETVVDRLVDSKRFGERWGRHWLDIARYGESTGRSRNYPFTFAWRYRDYVIDSFNADKPYDKFLTEQIAGDLLAKKSSANRRDNLVATGFLAMGTKDLNERNREQYLMDNIDDQIDTTTRSVLALTVSCARCHDHKFDPIPTKDYYALAGIFESTEILSGLNSRAQKGGYKATSKLIALSNKVQAEPSKPTRTDIQNKKLQERLAELRGEMKGEQRALIALNKRGGKKKPKDRRAASELANERQEHQKRVQELKKEIQEVSRSIKKKKNKGGGAAPTGDYAMGVSDAARSVNSRIRIRGEVSNKGSEVSRGFIQVLSGKKRPHFGTTSSGRLQLASWLTSEENPLTARVMVNRVWHHLFGRGIVRTVDNFGETGERPTHPELLDHLALHFQKDGWSIKRLIRKMVLSHTYRMSSEFSKAHYAIDPGNESLWRMRQKRLDAESLRDSMLAIGGELDLARPAGSPVMQLPIGEIGRTLSRVRGKLDGNYRSVYLPIMRSFVPQILRTFDFAEPSMVKGNRDVTTVSTQALYLMNNPFVMRQSRNLARSLLEREDLNTAGRIKLAYQLALSRAPDTFEAIRAMTYLKGFEDKPGKASGKDPELNALSSLCHALFSTAEFRYLN